MKVVSTEGLTKLIQLVKSAFVSVNDVVETQEVTLADVATSGDYDDLINKPTIGNATLTITQGGVSKGTFTANASSDVTIALDSGGGSYTAGTGIDITNNVISVTSPTLVNTATGTNSLTIAGTASTAVQGVNIGVDSSTLRNGVAIGYKAQNTGSYNVSIGYNSSCSVNLGYSVALGGGANTTASYAIQLGYGTNSEANSFYVGTSTSNNWKLLGSDGKIPDDRLNSTIARTSNIPTATSDLTNDSGYITSSALSGYATETWVGNQGYITGITSSDVTTALGYTPYNSSNPSGYITSSALTPYVLSADLATVATSGSYNDLSNKPTIPTVTSIYTATGTDAVNGIAVSNAIATKQDTLVSGTNIKTINGTPVLGSGNIVIESSSTPDVDGETISYNTDNELQTIAVKNKRDNSTLPIWQGTETQWQQGLPTTWYYWQTSIVDGWTLGTLPVNGNWHTIVYGNGVYLASYSNRLYRSTDGANWTLLTLPSGISMSSGRLCFGNGKFVITSGKNLAYSTDGETWTSITEIFTPGRYSVSFTNGYFITGGNPYAISTDGVNWTDISTNITLSKIIYANGVYVGYSNNGIYFSTDGVTFTLKQSSEDRSLALTYFKDKFIWFDGFKIQTGEYSYTCHAKAYYSVDGETWTQAATFSDWEIGTVITCASSDLLLCSTPHSDRTGSGGDNHYIYTTDGINWSSSIISGFSTSNNVTSIDYNGSNFVAVSGGDYKMSEGDYMGSNVSLTYQSTFYKCYTDTANPTTSSKVYSEPATQSALTISSVTSGAITLSDNNTYYYNQSGNAYSYQSVGDAHPDWLCFINGVGVKIGNITIASI